MAAGGFLSIHTLALPQMQRIYAAYELYANVIEGNAPFSREEMTQKYRNGGLTVALGNPKVAYVEGRCVGGGSEINSGLYHRPPPEILAQWRADFQVEGLTEADLNPHSEAVERDLTVSYLPGPAPPASLLAWCR